MDAITLAVRLAPARTTTQFREIVLTHTTRARDLDVVLAGALATAFAGVFRAAFDGGAFFAAGFVAAFLWVATGARASVRPAVAAGAGTLALGRPLSDQWVFGLVWMVAPPVFALTWYWIAPLRLPLDVDPRALKAAQ